jgi:competence protein ComGC
MNDFTLRNIVLIVYISSILYFYYIFNMIQLSKNTQNNRCDPIVIMTSKMMGFENNTTNFNTCIQDIQPEIYNDIKSNYEYMNKIIETTTTNMEEANNEFLSQLKNDYEQKNWDISNNIVSLNAMNTTMNEKILNTNNAINSTINNLISQS